MNTSASYAAFVEAATAPLPGSDEAALTPYNYQERIAAEGLPELLAVPTGCGKTLAVVLGWLWLRRFHPDAAVRAATPRRLVYVLPQRVLVEQVAADIGTWLRNLHLSDEVRHYVLMGGEGRKSGAWRLHPEDDAIIVATQDMALSAALNRQYGESRWSWPIGFGLLNSDSAWVFDEMQLMGPGLPTSRQLEGLRRAVGTAVDCTSTWMSATVDEDALRTVDLPSLGAMITLDQADVAGQLAKRFNATRRVEHIETTAKTYSADVARAVVAAHREGTRTIAVFNTVRRATESMEQFCKLEKAGELNAGLVLVHSRFRPPDRQSHLAAAIDDAGLAGPGTIVVTTQVLEAGVDITSDTMFTEASLWTSVVQRAGRCNRDGKATQPRLLWTEPPHAAPYEDAEVTLAVDMLTAIDGRDLSTSDLAGMTPQRLAPVTHATLRRRDLFELFDTLPDLSGSDLDISRFIRDADDRELFVAWEDLGDKQPEERHPLPSRAARCPVPISDADKVIERKAWRYDHLAERWVRCKKGDVRPGMVLLIDAANGGYDPALGWTPKSKRPVDPVSNGDDAASGLGADMAVDGDQLSMTRQGWLGLRHHLGDVEAEVQRTDDALEPTGLTTAQRRAAVIAGRLHDLGKAHSVFQETLTNTIESESERQAAELHGPPWAKSAGSKQARHSRKFFRHELASALALLGDGGVALEGEDEHDLIVYLVAAHHGRVRLGFRPLPGESPPTGHPDRSVALGIVDGDVLPPIEIPGMTLPETELDLSVMLLGKDVAGRPSWSQRMLPLRDRPDLGPFRLGYLEAIVRMADWRASASPSGSTSQSSARELP